MNVVPVGSARDEEPATYTVVLGDSFVGPLGSEISPNISSEELDKWAHEARINGYIPLDGLIRILASEEEYTQEIYRDAIPVLWRHYQLHLRSPKEIPITTFRNRYEVWRDLLYRWSGFGHREVREGLKLIPYLNIYGFDEPSGNFKRAENRYTVGVKYVSLDDFKEYLENVQKYLKIRLPLPSRLYGNDVEGEKIEVPTEDRDSTASPKRPRNTEIAKDSGPANLFHKNGEYFEIAFCGSKPFLLKESIGLKYIYLLLGRPGELISTIEMAQMRKEKPTSVSPEFEEMTRDQLEEFGMRKTALNSSQKERTLDENALDRYRKWRASCQKRLQEIEKELKEAVGNFKSIPELEEEWKMISQELEEDEHSPKGNIKDDNSRRAVTMAIKRAIEQIKEYHPSLAEYLLKTIKTGTSCTYHPIADQHIDWQF